MSEPWAGRTGGGEGSGRWWGASTAPPFPLHPPSSFPMASQCCRHLCWSSPPVLHGLQNLGSWSEGKFHPLCSPLLPPPAPVSTPPSVGLSPLGTVVVRTLSVNSTSAWTPMPSSPTPRLCASSLKRTGHLPGSARGPQSSPPRAPGSFPGNQACLCAILTSTCSQESHSSHAVPPWEAVVQFLGSPEPRRVLRPLRGLRGAGAAEASVSPAGLQPSCSSHMGLNDTCPLSQGPSFRVLMCLWGRD